MAKKRTHVYFSESDGYRYMHFGPEWVQGGMLINRPYNLSLEYQKAMAAVALFVPHPQSILQLGLGAGGFAKFCWKYLPEAKSTIVEISEDVYMACRMWFKLPEPDDRMEIVFEDCRKYLGRKNLQPFDWLFCDIYDETKWGPVYDDIPFYKLCKKALRDGGVFSVNLFGGEDFAKSHAAIEEAFDGRIIIMPEADSGNKVVLATKGPKRTFSIEELQERSAEIQKRLKIPAKQWLRGLQRENGFTDQIVF
ncbi:MAG: spermidine synthase [Burkholderiales bacterium]|nr:spermidine synthase [Burkholderiales bacterium]